MPALQVLPDGHSRHCPLAPPPRLQPADPRATKMGVPLPSLRRLLLCSVVLFLCMSALAHADDAADEEAAVAQMLADQAAEDAAMADVEEDAAEEDDDDAGAADADADSSRFDPTDPLVFPLTDMAEPAKDAEFVHAFAAGLGDGATLTLGEKARAVVAIANGGRSRLHVWGVMGSLNMPHDFGQYVQNFTYGLVNTTVGAGGEMSFDYEFVPNERLDTRDFVMALSVFYEAQGATGNVIRAHATTFLNQTVTAVAGPQTVGNAMFMVLLLATIAAASAAGFYVKSLSEEKKEKKAPVSEIGTEKPANDDWLDGHELQGRSQKKSAKSRKSK